MSRIIRMLVLFFLVALPGTRALAAAPSYVTETQTVELAGTFGIDVGLDANDVKEHYYFIRLDHPITVWDNVYHLKETNVVKIELAPAFNESLHNYKGKRVRVKGSLFHSFTAHHHTRILMYVKKLKDVQVIESH